MVYLFVIDLRRLLWRVAAMAASTKSTRCCLLWSNEKATSSICLYAVATSRYMNLPVIVFKAMALPFGAWDGLP